MCMGGLPSRVTVRLGCTLHVRSVFLLWTGRSVTNDYLGRFAHPRPAVSVICIVEGLVGQREVRFGYDGAE